jgi:hypothetical protein
MLLFILVAGRARVEIVGALHELGDDVSVHVRRGRVYRPEPGVLEVLRRHRVAVGPFYAVAQRESVGEPVFADLDVLRLPRHGPGVLVEPVQPFHGVDEHVEGDFVRDGRCGV